MTTREFQVCGIGGALVDILAEVPDSFVAGMAKGSMTLIDAARARDLYASMPPAIECSGGSGANTIACLASFGARVAFIGVTADDQFGNVFRHDMQAMGVRMTTPPIPTTPDIATSQCLILVTPDAQRTMHACLSASTHLSADHVDVNLIARSDVLYLEGYAFDSPLNKQAFQTAAAAAKASGTQIALTLSDSFCVERHRDDFLAFIRNGIDILFANEVEALHLTQTQTLEDASRILQSICPLTAVTCSDAGSKIVQRDSVIDVAAIRPAQLVDTTGAGDAYAGGFLYGLTTGQPLAACGRLGSLAAAEVISHMGPRPQIPLASLLKDAA